MKVTPARGPSSSLRHFRISVEDTVFFQIESPMSFKCFRRMVARWAIPGVLGFSTLIAVGQTNGIFADFATSMGSFTCQLDYTNAPRTVANFIGLATGQRAWLDLPTGRARTNTFYRSEERRVGKESRSRWVP